MDDPLHSEFDIVRGLGTREVEIRPLNASMVATTEKGILRRLWLWPARLLGFLLLVALFVIRLPLSWFYRNGRPTRWGRRGNALIARIYALGVWPGFLVALRVRGRRSGAIKTTALVMVEADGERYLVSMLGESAEWVRNVRAAAGEATIEHGREEHVRLVEVPPAERAPILKAYLRKASGARPHMKVDHRAPLAEFAKVANLYPTFRLVRIER